MNTLLSLKNICKEFSFANENLKILDSINCDLKFGETVAITGPSGSGKSTLLGVMAGLEPPTSGEILFEKYAIHNSTDDELCSWRRDKVGFIFQNFRLIKTLSAIENVAFPLEIKGKNALEAQSKARELLTALNLEKRLQHFPHQLSGGEKQRVAIARAYVHNPKIIFADEPTGNLDAHSAQKVLESLFAINANHETTLIVVTHDTAIANRMSRRLELIAGKLKNGHDS
ncbi:ABC transporter ATP-binding protein [Candidatus Uabimicrobium sp. HlEnr_7]|uniref:ABC transporter ATP-binding protein n=1 Tax=Candidatus Uabimicrobium helgolandensis TaxID=3095367 RepID=UPI0035568F8E